MRTRGLVAVVVVALGLAAVVAVTPARRAWRDHQDRKEIAARIAAMAPTAQVLLRITPPSGVENCGHEEWTRLNGDLCWKGSESPGRAALAMVQELRRVGASEVTVRCVRRELAAEAFCGVHANVAGRHWSAFVYPPPSSTSPGFWLSGNAGGGDFPGAGGTPVPPEQA
jgi:hypothetical protein